MSHWLKRILDNGLLEEAKPLYEENKPTIEAITAQGKQLLQEQGLIAEPDPQTEPKAALKFRLHQLLRHLLQLPRGEAFYLANELVGQLPQLLAMHPKLRGFVGVAQMLSHRGSDGTGKISAIAQGLGGSPWLLRAAQGGQHWVNGQQAYANAQGRQRHYQQMNSSQQQVVDLATLLLGLIEQPEVDAQQVNQITGQLELLLDQHFAELVDGLDEEHGAALNGICYGRWPRIQHFDE